MGSKPGLYLLLDSPEKMYGLILQVSAVGSDGLSIPEGGIFEYPLPGGEVGIDDAETLRIAMRPFEVVHQCPEKIAVDLHAVGNSPFHLAEVPVEEVDALRVVYPAIETGPLANGGTVFGNDDGQLVPLIKETRAPV